MTEDATPDKPAPQRPGSAPKPEQTPKVNGHIPKWEQRYNERIARGERIHVPKKDHGVVDPRESFARAPEYVMGALPKLYEDYFKDCIASWGGDVGAYACAFIAFHCAALHASVKVQTNPSKPRNFRNPNDLSLTLGKTGKAKSGMFMDLTRVYDEWQASMDKVSPSGKGKRGAAQHPPMLYLQTASTEGMILQISDNKGERLIMGCDEAMTFYTGAGAHHGDDGVSTMSDIVCAAYDGRSFRKRLVKTSYAIPEALATLIMATTFEKFAKWREFGKVIDSGMVGRHTVGIIAAPSPKNPKACIEGAEDRMRARLAALRGLRHMRFVIEPEAVDGWLEFTQRKDADNDTMERDQVNPGLVAWSRKYDLRIMSMATVLQANDYIEAGMKDHEEEVIEGSEGTNADAAAVTKLRTATITKANLIRAIQFVEGYLLESQAHFYEVAQGVTEYGSELVNFLAYRITNHSIDTPDDNFIARRELIHKGPASVRDIPDVDQRNEIGRRWIQTLLDYGWIEPALDKPGARQFRAARDEVNAAWYRLPEAFFHKFDSAEDRAWLKKHYGESREGGGKFGRGRGTALGALFGEKTGH